MNKKRLKKSIEVRLVFRSTFIHDTPHLHCTSNSRKKIIAVANTISNAHSLAIAKVILKQTFSKD